jgi:hypothetical protein
MQGHQKIVCEISWLRDPSGKGFKLIDATPYVEGTTLLGGSGGDPERLAIVDKGLIAYRPLDEFPSLYCDFANVNSVDTALSFVRQYGLLTNPSSEIGAAESAPAVVDQASRVSLLLEDFSRLGTVEMSDLPVLNSGMNLARSVAVQLVPGGGGLEIKMVPVNLWAAIWMQAFMAVAEPGRVVRRCGYCSNWFQAGVGTKRRADSKFCSPAHQKEFGLEKYRRGADLLKPKP